MPLYLQLLLLCRLDFYAKIYIILGQCDEEEEEMIEQCVVVRRAEERARAELDRRRERLAEEMRIREKRYT